VRSLFRLGVPAATISLWSQGRFALVDDVAMTPEFRNRGVARTMISDICN
jgi:hypothetical protein